MFSSCYQHTQGLGQLTEEQCEACIISILQNTLWAKCSRGRRHSPHRADSLEKTTHSLPPGFPGVSALKKPPANAGDTDSIPGVGRSPGEGMATHSSILAWRISWTEEPGGLQSMGSQRVRHDWRDSAHTAHQGSTSVPGNNSDTGQSKYFCRYNALGWNTCLPTPSKVIQGAF